MNTFRPEDEHFLLFAIKDSDQCDGFIATARSVLDKTREPERLFVGVRPALFW